MFGTLVIQLPSYYSGGKLIVYHQEKKSEFDYSGPGCCSNYYFTSFYADCQHEVEKVTKGYRLCLIYNLMYQGLDECPTPADYQTRVSTIVSAMKQWEEDIESEDCPDVMTYFLKNKYCEADLSFQMLENCDRTVADALTQAKNEIDFDLYVGHVNLTQRWYAEYYDYDSYETEYCDSLVLVNLRDEEHSLSQVQIGIISFVQQSFFDTIEPYAKEFLGDPYDVYFMEGLDDEAAKVGLKYSWTALLLWPVTKRTSTLGVNNLICLLEQDVHAGKVNLDDAVITVMREIRRRDPSIETCLPFLRALQAMGDIKSISELLHFIVGTHSYILRGFIKVTTFCSSVVCIGHEYGWDVVRSSLLTMFSEHSSSSIEECCAFLKEMVTLYTEEDLCKSLLGITVEAMTHEQDAASGMSSKYSSWKHYRRNRPPRVYRSKKFVIQLFSILTSVGSNALFDSTVSTLCSKPLSYPVLETLGPAIVDFFNSAVHAERDKPLKAILNYCILQLQSATCPCKDCIELMQFLENPAETQCQFKMDKHRRWHFYQQLDISGFNSNDVKELFAKKEYSLVVTKDSALHKKNIKKNQQKQVLLASLYSLLSTGDVTLETEPPAKKWKGTSKVTSESSYIDLS